MRNSTFLATIMSVTSVSFCCGISLRQEAIEDLSDSQSVKEIVEVVTDARDRIHASDCWGTKGSDFTLTAKSLSDDTIVIFVSKTTEDAAERIAEEAHQRIRKLEPRIFFDEMKTKHLQIIDDTTSLYFKHLAYRSQLIQSRLHKGNK